LVEVEKNRSIEIEVEAAKVKPFVVVGIPAFNKEQTIAKVVLESQRFADKVVVCDDGSSDMTAETAERLGADVASHERNLGYGAAIQSFLGVLGSWMRMDSMIRARFLMLLSPSWKARLMLLWVRGLLMSVRLMLCRGIGGLA